VDFSSGSGPPFFGHDNSDLGNGFDATSFFFIDGNAGDVDVDWALFRGSMAPLVRWPRACSLEAGNRSATRPAAGVIEGYAPDLFNLLGTRKRSAAAGPRQ
jgi:hypothetical protein